MEFKRFSYSKTAISIFLFSGYFCKAGVSDAVARARIQVELEADVYEAHWQGTSTTYIKNQYLCFK